MLAYLASLGVWVWFIAAAVLFAVEIIAPGAFMMWLGLSALLVGLISFAIVLSWQTQLVLFAIFSIASVPLWRRFFRAANVQADQPFLNRRGEAIIGSTLTLETPIVDGFGTVKVGDTVWRVRGPEIPKGSRVMVTGADATVLVVAPAGVGRSANAAA